MPQNTRRAILRRLVPLLILGLGMALFFLSGLNQILTFETLKENRDQLLHFVASYPWISPLLYILIYSTVVALSVPGGAVMTITGGFLFGSFLGTIYVIIAATLGATILFSIARTALGDSLRAKAGPWIKKMQKGFQKDGFHYLLVLRLIPLFPFFVVNLVPAFLGITTRTYVTATLIGIIPGSFVYATVGAGIGSIFDAGETFDPANIMTREIWISLGGLVILALLPIIYKRWKHNQKGRS